MSKLQGTYRIPSRHPLKAQYTRMLRENIPLIVSLGGVRESCGLVAWESDGKDGILFFWEQL